jgi:outer membrane protein assembly factor BamB
MMVYGKLMSAWPITAVMAHEGTLYGIAGHWMQNGSVAFALDAATGAAKWTRWTAPGYGVAPGAKNTLYEREDHAFSPCGQLAMVGGHLWARGHLGFPAIFEPKSGARLPLAPDFRQLAGDPWALGVRTASAGQDILVLDAHTVLQGGHPLLSNPDMRHDKSAAKFLAWMTDAQGRVTASPLPQWAVPHSQIAPAVQGDDVLIVGGVGKDGRSANSTIGLSLWSVAAWKKEYTATPGAKNQAADPDAADPNAPKGKGKTAAVKTEIGNFKTTLDMSKARWRIDEMDVNAIALTADAAIVAHGVRESYGPFVKHPGFKGWRLTALDRNTGEPRWNIDLPCEPVFNGLAPAADGRWVLTLRDGSVAVIGQ